MIQSCAPRPSQSLPLLVWQDLQALDGLRKQRDALISRAAALPPHAHRRVELEARIRDLTSRILTNEQVLHARIGGGR